MTVFLNRVKMTTATTGTGTMTLGSALTQYQTVAAAGGLNGDILSYLIIDGNAWEVGVGTYTSSGTTLSRTLVQSSTASLLNLSGSATVSIIEQALDITSMAAIVAPQGRLTLTSSTPVLTANVTAATTVYYTPYKGVNAPIYDKTTGVLVNRVFSELSQATTDSTKSPAACGNNSNYDIFRWDDSGTDRATRGPAWSSDTSRGTGAGTTELELVNGFYRNKVAITNGPAAGMGIYLGTVRTDGSAKVNMYVGATGADGGGANVVGVWNMYNRVLTVSENNDTTDSWPYTTLTWRKKNNNSNNRISFVCGLAEDAILFAAEANHSNTSGVQAGVSVGVDSETSATTGGSVHFSGNVANLQMEHNAKYTGYLLGFHYCIQLEISVAAGTTTWVGDNGASEKWSPSRLEIMA